MTDAGHGERHAFHYNYERDGQAIYDASFATIRAEAGLERFPDDVSRVVVRMIHAAGQTDLAGDVEYSDDVVSSARAALVSGAPIFADAHMVASGVTRKRLPADNDVLCHLRDENVPALAADIGTTRSAAALEAWVPRLGGSVVAIGNAPTALFHLLEMLRQGAPVPAAIVGCPVGFIGAAESKEALAHDAAELGVPFITVRGRRGGSAITAAAVNALASVVE
ncbi:MAG TPA: precorrin-8X methylmutase [Dietzia timorensis]|uniref:Precorrin-8X methylmutase n=1 Tax=Dietzia timorensis TaxID=499555 RepID=A0A921JZ31_9ACTN|nr:precorrin-8X methylmutase [Dietzia timorensis]HJE90516.1 precorrin-8X methylmutase [Dietzia timorensis]